MTVVTLQDLKHFELMAKLEKMADNAAPSAHIRAWDPSEKETEADKKLSINHVEGNVGTDRKATDPGVDSPSHKATDGGVNAPSNKATDINSADDIAAPIDEAAGNSGSGGNGPSDVRSPTSTEVRSPTSTEVRSPTSTSTEVRSPTSTSTEAYTADNFTATVTGGAGAGANTTVNIYLTPPKSNKNTTVEAMSLTGKLLVLSSKLRAAGYTKQAENLENTFVMYKKAEAVDPKLLYNAHAETGDDLLEFAHPDGDVEVSPAQDHHGDVETPISQHKKIINIVQKKVAQEAMVIPKNIATNFQMNLSSFIEQHFQKYFPYLNSKNLNPKSRNLLVYAKSVYDLSEDIINTFKGMDKPISSNVMMQYMRSIIKNKAAYGKISEEIKLSSIEDIHHAIKAIKDGLTMEMNSPSNAALFNKAAIVNMLRTSLNVKTADSWLDKEILPRPPSAAQEAQKKHNQEGAAEFEDMINEFDKTLMPYFTNIVSSFEKAIPDVDNKKLKSGKTFSEWKEFITDHQENFIESIRKYNLFVNTPPSALIDDSITLKNNAISTPHEFIYGFVAFCNDLSSGIADDTLKVDRTGMTLVNNAKIRAGSLMHRWENFWEIYGGGGGKGSPAQLHHGALLTPGQIKRMFQLQNNRLDSISRYISTVLLATEESKLNPNIHKFLNDVVTDTIAKLKAGFTGAMTKAQAHFDAGLKYESSGGKYTAKTSEITPANIKEFFSDNAILLEQLDFTSIQTINDSMIRICSELMEALEELINKNKVFERDRASLLSGLAARKEAILGLK